MVDYRDRADIIDVTDNYFRVVDRNEWHELDSVFLPVATAVLGATKPPTGTGSSRSVRMRRANSTAAGTWWRHIRS
ncbi:MAG: SnoaL-like domain-containing protein [Acidimicrobiaceae bacterium]|nr:SnoaL-like domain-containing protein [Acidimicrobiaceae bacterium]